MQSTAGFTGERKFLARGAFACFGITPLALPIRAKSPSNTFLEVSFCHGEIFTVYGVSLYPILSGVARCGWLAP